MSASAIACAHRTSPDLPATVMLGPVQLLLNVIGPLAKAAGSKRGARLLMGTIVLWCALGPAASTISAFAR